MNSTNFAYLSDEELFNPQRVFYSQEEVDECKQEREKRLEKKRQAQERIERERLARLTAIKEALPYSDAVAQEICERVSAGELLTIICREDDMPTTRRCNQWLKE